MVLLPLLVLGTSVSAATWYGPASVSFRADFPGNPYDAGVNDVRVRFTKTGAEPIERLAYFDDGQWKAVLAAPNAGSYRATLLRAGKPVPGQAQTVHLKNRLSKGYLRIEPTGKRFRFDSGEPYWPLGHNLGWQNGDLPDLTEQLGLMAKNGMNWARIWACHWDGKNPFFPPEGGKLELGRLNERALARWDAVIQAAESAGVRFQFVLFHHGLFSSTVNPNWPEHPWNKAKGGFLENAADFFTDPTCKRLARQWLRYAVARWGHSQAIMAWELFNEVEWVDARYQDRWADIARWHGEMARYVKSIDPYRHLVTSSSAMEQEALWKDLDYYQPHTYPPEVFSAIAGMTLPKDKPLFFGEFGPGNYVASRERYAVRDGIWAGLLACHAGAGQYWYWDRVIQQNLSNEFKTASQVLMATGYAGRIGMKPLKLKLDAPLGADLEFGPGQGWAATTKFEFNLPTEATAANLNLLSGYFNSQSGGNKALFPKPLVFRFRAGKPGEFRVRLGTLAKGGARIKVFVNDSEAIDKNWTAGNSDRPLNETLSAEFPAGNVVIRLESVGADWVVLQGFSISGIAPQVRAAACGDGRVAIVRLTANSGAKLPAKAGLGGLGIPDGDYTMNLYDLDSGRAQKSAVKIRGGGFHGELTIGKPDVVLALLPAK